MNFWLASQQLEKGISVLLLSFTQKGKKVKVKRFTRPRVWGFWFERTGGWPAGEGASPWYFPPYIYLCEAHYFSSEERQVCSCGDTKNAIFFVDLYTFSLVRKNKLSERIYRQKKKRPSFVSIPPVRR